MYQKQSEKVLLFRGVAEKVRRRDAGFPGSDWMTSTRAFCASLLFCLLVTDARQILADSQDRIVQPVKVFVRVEAERRERHQIQDVGDLSKAEFSVLLSSIRAEIAKLKNIIFVDPTEISDAIRVCSEQRYYDGKGCWHRSFCK